MLYVTKADGSKQPFDKQKIVRTCIRMRLTDKQARDVANRVEQAAREGMPTKKILQLIFSYAQQYRPEVKHLIDLREAISMMCPKPDFEIFVRKLLQEYGYDTSPAQLINGDCVEHEIDGIAKRGNEVIYIEVKHHYQHHTYTGLNICLEAKATLEDLIAGFGSKNKVRFNRGLVVCNTKFSDHAKQYADCAGVQLLGWNTPVGAGLETMIEDKKLYPITLLKILDAASEAKLGNNGIVLLKQLVQTDISELYRITKIPKPKLKLYQKYAAEILANNNSK